MRNPHVVSGRYNDYEGSIANYYIYLDFEDKRKEKLGEQNETEVKKFNEQNEAFPDSDKDSQENNNLKLDSEPKMIKGWSSGTIQSSIEPKSSLLMKVTSTVDIAPRPIVRFTAFEVQVMGFFA